MKERPFYTTLLVSAVLSLFLLASASSSSALATFADLGVDGKTMQVTDPSILKAAGMKDVKAGDTVTLKKEEGRPLIVTNLRTGQGIPFPPPSQQGATKKPPASK